MIGTDIGQTTHDRITIRGRDLADELIGKVDFVDMMMLTSCDREATEQEKTMSNAVMVSVMDHGFTPSSLAARLTYLGAPEAPQAAIAAGLLGAGSVFLGAMQNAASMLTSAASGLTEDSTDQEVAQAASDLVQVRRQTGEKVFGLGHNIHSHGDPRVPRMRDLAKEHGYYDRHWRLLDAIEQALPQEIGRSLPINNAGAIGACVAALNLPASMARGLTLVARTAGLVAHLLEEDTAPVGKEVWHLVLQQDPRNEYPHAEGSTR